MAPHGYIYLARNTANGKVYIGQTTQTIAMRWKQHLSKIAGVESYPFYSALRKYGSESFVVSEIARAFSQQELNQMESKFITEHASTERGRGYNVRAGGDCGGRLSIETRRKLSEKQKGRPPANKGKKMPESQRLVLARRMRENPPCLGRVISEETKSKIGAANRLHMLGRKQSDETKRKHSEATLKRFAAPGALAKHSASLMGRECSLETREKISFAQKGRNVPEERCQKIAESVGRLWTDPVFRANQIAKRMGKKQTDAAKDKMRALWADPEWRANQVAKRLGNKPSDDTRQKLSEAITRAWATRRNRVEGVACQ